MCTLAAHWLCLLPLSLALQGAPFSWHTRNENTCNFGTLLVDKEDIFVFLFLVTCVSIRPRFELLICVAGSPVFFTALRCLTGSVAGVGLNYRLHYRLVFGRITGLLLVWTSPCCWFVKSPSRWAQWSLQVAQVWRSLILPSARDDGHRAQAQASANLFMGAWAPRSEANACASQAAESRLLCDAISSCSASLHKPSCCSSLSMQPSCCSLVATSQEPQTKPKQLQPATSCAALPALAKLSLRAQHLSLTQWHSNTSP